MENNRRSFLKKTAIAGIGLGTHPFMSRAAKDTSTGTRAADPAEDGKQFRLYAEILSFALERPEQELFIQRLEKAIPEYGIDEVWIHGFNLIDDWVTWSEFPKLRRELDAGRVAAYRKQLQRLKKHGVRITLSGRGPDVPDGFFEAYPEARKIYSGKFQEFIRKSVADMFRVLPEADAYELYLWETPFLNDVDFFKGMYHWAESHQAANLSPTFYYDRSDFLSETLKAYAQGVQDAGKKFAFLTFSHVPWQENLIIEALRKIDHSIPIVLDHKVQPGDWTPHRLANNVMLKITDREALLSYDAVGEYWGQSQIPYCYPEEIQQRLQHALKHNRSINALKARVFWANGHNLFGNFDEVNFYALSQLAKNPNMPIEQIWTGWAEKRFGREAAPRVIAALERTNEIANRFYYIHGAWVQNHSALSNLPYLESHVLQYAQSMIEWNPADFRTNALLWELTENPRERTIRWVVAEREEALRLNRLSMEDIESVRAVLPPAEYDKLKHQFTLQRHFIETAIPHIEAFLRYRIQKQNPSEDNRKGFEYALERLEAKALEVERLYREQSPILSRKLIDEYVRQIRLAFPAPESDNIKK